MFERLSENVYCYRDICNVYVIRHGQHAVLVDFGTGLVLQELEKIDVAFVDFVVHTHYHRDQCLGDALLSAHGIDIYVGEREAQFFESAEELWQNRRVYDVYDLATEYNSLTFNAPVAKKVRDYEVLHWRDIDLLALPTPGHTRGSLTYLGLIDGVAYGFCGDLVYADGYVRTLYDLQWHYTEPDGLNVALHSVSTLRRRGPELLAPAHGDVLRDPGPSLLRLEERLGGLFRLVGQRLRVTLGSPTVAAIDARCERLSDHVIGVSNPCSNFYVLMSESGENLFFDYGFPSLDHQAGADYRFIEHSLRELGELAGIARADVLILSHYHDDHICGANFLQQEYGTTVWAYDRFADVVEKPSAYRLPCLWREPVHVDRTIGDAESVTWREYTFEIRPNPGHTWYAASLYGVVDGMRVEVTGDELLLSGLGELRAGGPMFRNRVEHDSFTSSVKRMLEYEPELILTGHSGGLRVTRGDLERAYIWCRDLEESWAALVAFPEDLPFAIDPDIVTVYPYQTRGYPGDTHEVDVVVRNVSDDLQRARMRLLVPKNWKVAPREQAVDVADHSERRVPFAVTSPAGARAPWKHVVPVDVTLGSRELGPITEAIFILEQEAVS
jgi:glyoxylase-like metal-dependent hydrolase (beta-lactamase superfamily II)